ncbi:MAG: exosome complex component Rrp42, partial [Thermoproteota archaeon]
MTSSVLDQLKRKEIVDLLDQGKRIDGRAFDQPRPLSIETGVIPKANGSARVRLGDTEIVTGIKIQPDKPFPDLGDKGIFICTAEILPLAHPDAEPGPPGEDVIELARVVDRGIRESGMIDMSKLVLEKDKSVIGIFADNSVVDHDGNLFDACSYATTAAILS